jgi:hypothetical protein
MRAYDSISIPTQWPVNISDSHASATLIDNTRTHDQDAPASSQALAAPFVDHERTLFVATTAASIINFRPPHLDFSGSPSHGSPGGTWILSLDSGRGTSESLSVQYEDSSRALSGNTSTSNVTVQNWRIHFAELLSSATAVALLKPMTTATLLQKLELDEDAVGCFLVFPPSIHS